ncbi:MAG: beta-ketoacyl synthase N-terminal-like domain-containing protein [Thermoguttaceae bacterium]
MGRAEVVITGVGVVSSIGIGREAFWEALLAGHCGIGPATQTNLSGMPPQLVGEVRNFDARTFVANRKSLKVMSRDAQLGVAASTLACRDAGIRAGMIDPERFGVVLGADQICSPIQESEATYLACIADGRFDFQLWGTKGMAASFPLGFLRVLPNMVASHVSIAQDARGPNNTIHEGEISSLLAVSEAASVIQRGMADVMLAGGASSQMQPLDFVRRMAMGNLSPRQEDPASVVRPFDARRDGYVWSEGAAVVVLESRKHAELRAAKILARLKGCAATFESVNSQGKLTGSGLRRAIAMALDRAAVKPDELGHVKAHGLSTVRDDALEAAVLHDSLPQTPVTALKAYFGNAAAAGAAIELAASIIALNKGCVPAVLNYEHSDPACPVRVIRDRPLVSSLTNALCLTWMPFGQAAAVVVGQ